MFSENTGAWAPLLAPNPEKIDPARTTAAPLATADDGALPDTYSRTVSGVVERTAAAVVNIRVRNERGRHQAEAGGSGDQREHDQEALHTEMKCKARPRRFNAVTPLVRPVRCHARKSARQYTVTEKDVCRG